MKPNSATNLSYTEASYTVSYGLALANVIRASLLTVLQQMMESRNKRR